LVTDDVPNACCDAFYGSYNRTTPSWARASPPSGTGVSILVQKPMGTMVQRSPTLREVAMLSRFSKRRLNRDDVEARFEFHFDLDEFFAMTHTFCPSFASCKLCDSRCDHSNHHEVRSFPMSMAERPRQQQTPSFPRRNVVVTIAER